MKLAFFYQLFLHSCGKGFKTFYCNYLDQSIYISGLIKYRISANSFRGNYSFFNLTLCTVTFDHSTYRCGNYSREETIQGRKLFAEIRYWFSCFVCLFLSFFNLFVSLIKWAVDWHGIFNPVYKVSNFGIYSRFQPRSTSNSPANNTNQWLRKY